jgi:predicted metal-dependent phosphoesterase TrpH
MFQMREWVLDLHIHTVLSPCADRDMLPEPVIKRAKKLGIDVLGITDHNSAENVAAFVAKGREADLVVLPGMEVQTVEDVHLICLFDTVEQALAWQEIVYRHLPSLKNRKDSFGEQWVVDKEGRVLYEVDRLLILGTDLTVEQVVTRVHELGGLCIAAHIDRDVFSLWESLGFIPEELQIDGVELTPHLPRRPDQLRQLRRQGFLYLVASDAHFLDHICPPQCFAYMETCCIKELKQALADEDGRCIHTSV